MDLGDTWKSEMCNLMSCWLNNLLLESFFIANVLEPYNSFYTKDFSCGGKAIELEHYGTSFVMYNISKFMNLK